MTKRLYRTNSYLTNFEARILQTLEQNGKPALVLDQTAFYPTSGGQPHDLGEINGVRIIDVIERGDEILHVLGSPHPSPLPEGEGANGEIDWPRRFDHMQQHSGQHVLSQAFVRVAGLDTVAVHIGTDEDTLDLPTPRLAPEVIERAEAEANRVLAEDIPFVVYEVSDADLPRIPLRKPPKVTGRIRIVEIKDYDWSACGGTHVRSTAQIGLIKITRAEKRGNDTRVTFRCGLRALADYSRLNTMTSKLMEMTSAGRYDISTVVEKLQTDARADHKALQDATAKLLYHEADALLTEAALREGQRVIIQVFENRDVNDVRALAKLLVAQPNVVALLGLAGEKCQLIFARSKDTQGDMGQMLKCALTTLSPIARGGGSPDFAQGGGVQAEAAILRAVIESIR